MAKRLSKKWERRVLSKGDITVIDQILLSIKLFQQAEREGVTLNSHALAALGRAKDLMEEYPNAFRGKGRLPDPVRREAGWIRSALFDAISEIAPSDCYFGDDPFGENEIGFWPSCWGYI